MREYSVGYLVRDAVDGETNYFGELDEVRSFLVGSNQQEPTIMELFDDDSFNITSEIVPIPNEWGFEPKQLT